MGVMKTFVPKLVQVDFNGLTITGFADGTMVKVTGNADDFTLVKGADGEGARIASADDSAEVEFSLLQTAAANDELSAMRTQDKLDGTGHGPLLVKDLSGRTLLHAEQAWIKRLPDPELGKDHSPRTWTLVCDSLEAIIGGN